VISSAKHRFSFESFSFETLSFEILSFESLAAIAFSFTAIVVNRQ
jgi:hypothetical protein